MRVVGCRNVLRATIEVPEAGEINFHCTHLDHLDEGWRMKQVDAIIRSGDGPHILAGGLNALDGTDYSAERWEDIVKVRHCRAQRSCDVLATEMDVVTITDGFAVLRGDRQADAESGGDEVPQGEAVRRRQGLCRRMRSCRGCGQRAR